MGIVWSPPVAVTVIPNRTSPPALSEKFHPTELVCKHRNPVVDSTELAYKETNLVHIDAKGVTKAAWHIHQRLQSESYTPRTWRTHPLHICPPEPYDPSDRITKLVINWIFLISSLNFSFWSEKEGQPDRYGVEWWEGWSAQGAKKVWTGYWSLPASLNRAIMSDDLPITDPAFYSSETLCPDSLIEHVFRSSSQSREAIPLLKERIAIMREVGYILCTSFGGSFQGFLEEFQGRHGGEGTAIDLVHMVTETFPSFRDEVWLDGRKVYFWKRAQILVAELWAAFYPPQPSLIGEPAPAHPLFPGIQGADIGQLTMFADYRIPQILHHLRIITYPTSLERMLHEGLPLAPGSREEISVRAASIVAVERVREEMAKLNKAGGVEVSSVLIDFYLWDLAKRLETGEDRIDGIDTAETLPIHRTRSIWY